MRPLSLLTALSVVALSACQDGPTEPQDFMVEGRVALASLVSLSDGHLQQIANDFQMLAGSEDGRSGDWERIRGATCRTAPTWPKLMAGQTVIGDLVASRATGKSSAIVAVPVLGEGGAIIGVLGSSVYLDSLSLRIKSELDLQPNQIFFSIDATPIGALQDDPAQIFLDPLALGEPELERAIREMLTHEEGVVNYHFRGKPRTVLYRKSHVSGWWYAFGRVWD